MSIGKDGLTMEANGRVLSTQVQEAIRGAAQKSATALREAEAALKEGIEAARAGGDEARRQVDEARRNLDRVRSEADRSRAASVAATSSPRGLTGADNIPAPAAAPAPARMPKMAIPPITGGKLVTGTLNGGGPEIRVDTMNGDVTLRKLEQ